MSIQNDVSNKMIEDASERMRIIAANLIPLVSSVGDPMDICDFNEFVHKSSSHLEKEVYHNKQLNESFSFTGPVILKHATNTFLFNLGMVLCRMYNDVCENCPDYETCQGRKGSKPEKGKVISFDNAPMNEGIPMPFESRSILLPEDEFIRDLSSYAKAFPEEFDSPEMKEYFKRIKEKARDIYHEDYYDIEKLAKLLALVTSLVERASQEFKKHQDDEEFL